MKRKYEVYYKLHGQITVEAETPGEAEKIVYDEQTTTNEQLLRNAELEMGTVGNAAVEIISIDPHEDVDYFEEWKVEVLNNNTALGFNQWYESKYEEEPK